MVTIMAMPACQCTMPAAFCRPVFDPGGTPPEDCSSHLLVRGQSTVRGILFPVTALVKPTNLSLLRADQGLSGDLLHSESTDTSTSLRQISDLIDRGHLDQVLHTLRVMYAHGIVPDNHVYWSYLKACNQRNALFFAMRLHAHLVLHGLEFISSLSDYFLSTLFNCGGFKLALRVFHMRSLRTSFSWKAIITAYIDNGLEQEAMVLYELMLEDGIEPDKYTYVSLIRACSCLLDLRQGKALHADAQERFLHVDDFVGSALIHFYGKCKNTIDAENVFEGLWQRDVVVWNSMLSMYVEQGEAQKAFQLYRQMHEEGPRPNNRTFVAAISACCILAESEENVWMCQAIAEAFHVDAWRMGFKSNTILSNNLMNVYGKCGSMARVQAIFIQMLQESVVSWTVMLNAYLEQGHPETALQLYRQMQQEGVHPDESAFTVALRACCSLAKKEEPVFVDGQWTCVTALTIGKALHSDARDARFDSCILMRNTLIGLYGMCGRIMEAENIFSGLSEPNVVSFNAMLLAYIEQGEEKRALRLYRQMKEDGLPSDQQTTAIALQACRILAEKEQPVLVQGSPIKVVSLDIGRSLHCDALRDGVDLSGFLTHTLLSLYRQCGSFEEAMNCANGPTARNSTYWIEVLSLYSVEGKYEKALQIFKYMQDEGVSPNKWAYVIAIQACCAIATKKDAGASREWALNVVPLIGEALHVDAWKDGFSSDIFIGSTLLTLYSICGDIVAAEIVFARLSQPDIVLWNALLRAYVEQGDGVKALRLYRILQSESDCQNQEGTFIAALQACGILAEKEGAGLESYHSMHISPLVIGKALHADARKKGLDSLASVCSALVIMYGKLGSIIDAETMFTGLVQHDIVSCTSLLQAYLEHGEAEKALQLFTHIQTVGIIPDEQSFVSALEACAKLAESEESFSMEGPSSVNITCLKIGWALHADCLNMGYDLNEIVCSKLVIVYGCCRALVEAETAFNRLPKHSLMLWNTMLSTYIDHGQGEKVLQFYRLFQDEGMPVDESTLVSVVQACSLTGNLETCKQVHYLIECMGYNGYRNLRNIITHAYGSCSSIHDCRAMFDSISQPDVVSWNALIGGYARQGKYEPCMLASNEMQQAGIIPNEVTVLLLLSVCSHAGKVDRGFENFQSMPESYGIVLKEEHYDSMVDLLGRVGDFTRAKDFLTKEFACSSLSAFLKLLGASQKHGNIELGSWAFDRLVHMQSEQPQAYITMSNIHARM